MKNFKTINNLVKTSQFSFAYTEDLKKFHEYKDKLEQIRMNAISRSHLNKFLKSSESFLTHSFDTKKEKDDINEEINKYSKLLYINFSGLKKTYNYYYLFKMLNLVKTDNKDMRNNIIRDFLENKRNKDSLELNLLFYMDILKYLNEMNKDNKDAFFTFESKKDNRLNYGFILSINIENVMNKVLIDASNSEVELYELFIHLLVSLFQKYTEMQEHDLIQNDFGKMELGVVKFEKTIVEKRLSKLSFNGKLDILYLLNKFTKYTIRELKFKPYS